MGPYAIRVPYHETMAEHGSDFIQTRPRPSRIKSATLEFAAFLLEKDGQWRAAGYYIN
jgi:hypothetical protein